VPESGKTENGRTKPEPTYDEENKRRVGHDKEDGRSRLLRFWDRFVWPRVHGKWWTFDVLEKKTQTPEEICARLRLESPEQAKETLDHVEAIAQGAVDRAAAADRRAGTIAGTVAIAATFTLTGGGLALDHMKLTDPDLRKAFAIGLVVTTAAFVLSVFYALRALVSARVWSWSEPFDLPVSEDEDRKTQLGMRAAHLLQDFAGNWEISDLKNRLVDLALRWLLLALAAIVCLAAIILADVVS
jgi:hypothetical protein